MSSEGVPVEGTHETVPEDIPSDTEMLDWVLRTGARIHCPDGLRTERRYVMFNPASDAQPRTAPDGVTVREAVLNGMKYERELIDRFDLPEPFPYLDPEGGVGQVMQQTLPGAGQAIGGKGGVASGLIPNAKPEMSEGLKRMRQLAGVPDPDEDPPEKLLEGVLGDESA